jgi:uncharacterized membrane protein
MNDLMSVVDWSRAQFALTAMYHWLFVPLTIGLSLIVAIMETIYLKTGEERWKAITKFWMLLFGINFACGVATGIILEFEFGTNWSNYRRYLGVFHGVHIYCCNVLWVEQGEPKISPRIIMADSIRRFYISSMDFNSKLLDAKSGGYGI